MPKYLTLEMVDDHYHGEAPTWTPAGYTIEPRLVREVVGVYVLPGATPVVVACGPSIKAPFKDARCLNKVVQHDHLDGDGKPHLTARSVTTLTAYQLNFLHDTGGLDFERPGAFVKLIEAENQSGQPVCEEPGCGRFLFFDDRRCPGHGGKDGP